MCVLSEILLLLFNNGTYPRSQMKGAPHITYCQQRNNPLQHSLWAISQCAKNVLTSFTYFNAKMIPLQNSSKKLRDRFYYLNTRLFSEHWL
jgi:hypothetical protein